MKDSNAAKVRVRVGQYNHIHCVFVDGAPLFYGVTKRQMNRFAVGLRTELGHGVAMPPAALI